MRGISTDIAVNRRAEDDMTKLVAGFLPGLSAFLAQMKSFFDRKAADDPSYDEPTAAQMLVVTSYGDPISATMRGDVMMRHGPADDNRRRRAGDNGIVGVLISSMTAKAKAAARAMNNISTRRAPAMVLNC